MLYVNIIGHQLLNFNISIEFSIFFQTKQDCFLMIYFIQRTFFSENWKNTPFSANLIIGGIDQTFRLLMFSILYK